MRPRSVVAVVLALVGCYGTPFHLPHGMSSELEMLEMLLPAVGVKDGQVLDVTFMRMPLNELTAEMEHV